MRTFLLFLFCLSAFAFDAFAQNASYISLSHAPDSPIRTDYTVFTITGTDADGVKSIDVYIDGILEKTCSGITVCQIGKRFSFAGTYTYYATVVDAKGEATTSPLKSFTVSLEKSLTPSPGTPSSSPASPSVSSAPPVVSTSHSPVSPLVSDYPVVFSSASDSDGIKSIIIYVDDTLKQTCQNTTTCQTSSAQYAIGSHSYHARAEDFKSFTTTSPTKTFVVFGAQKISEYFLGLC